MSLRALSVLLTCWIGAGLFAYALPAGAESSPLHRKLDPAMQCEHCHSTDSWQFDFERVKGTPFDHGWTGFPLRGRHAQAACLDCHEEDMRPARACRNCHEDRHKGRLGQDCDRCHNADAWSDVSPFTAHRNARLPLFGMHALIECSACHTQTTASRADAPPSECFACHQQDYELHTNHPRHFADGGRDAFPRDCRQCHSALAWSPARLPRELARFESARVAGLGAGLRTMTRREHERRFPIALGAHRSAECSDCHAGASPAAITCVGCHAHAEPLVLKQHASIALPASRSGALCLTCHVRGARR